MLFTGDIEEIAEKEILEEVNRNALKSNILKVGHHGSNTSTSDTFIKYLTPKEAVISVGKNNKYGHPHKEVINILKKNKVTIRRTDEEGTISYLSYFQ